MAALPGLIVTLQDIEEDKHPLEVRRCSRPRWLYRVTPEVISERYLDRQKLLCNPYISLGTEGKPYSFAELKLASSLSAEVQILVLGSELTEHHVYLHLEGFKLQAKTLEQLVPIFNGKAEYYSAHHINDLAPGFGKHIPG